jgi:phosphate-selective porin OprO/OprP
MDPLSPLPRARELYISVQKSCWRLDLTRNLVMFKLKRHSLPFITLAGLAVSTAGLNAGETNTLEELKRELEALDQKVRALEHQLSTSNAALKPAAGRTPTVSLGSGGFNVTSADSNFVFRVHGYVQADARAYLSDEIDTAATDTFLIRRARPIFEGTVYDRFDYRVMLDFASQTTLSSANNGLLQDAYVTARLWPELQLQAGKFTEPIGLERLRSSANLTFIERGYPSQLVPNRDVGFQVQGDLFHQRFRYEAGVFNGVANSGSTDFDTTDGDKDLAGRIFALPFKTTDIEALQRLGLGLGGSYGNQEGSLRTFASEGFQRFFRYRTSSVAGDPNVVADGNLWRLAPQAYYYYGPFGLLAEYVVASQEVRQTGGGPGAGSLDRLTHTGWQVALSCFLSSDRNGYESPSLRRPLTFRDGSGWGALELVARVHGLEVDDDAFPIYADPAASATRARSFGFGLNWHLNRNVKLCLDYARTDFEGEDGNPYADESEDLILTRVQFAF